MTKPPKSIFDLIDKESFRMRTTMYTGEKKISMLKAFMDGYFYAAFANDIRVADDIKFDTFHDWVAQHFGWPESTAGWKNIILQECNGDEDKAVDKFFELYDKFKLK